MNKLPNHTALKEWSNVIESLGRGEQIILIRKGGIADPHFGIEADRFYLYPTYFHQGESEARPHVEAYVALDSSLERDLGLDSLARVELVLRLEREFATSLPEQALASSETPRDLLRFLLASSGQAPHVADRTVASLVQSEGVRPPERGYPQLSMNEFGPSTGHVMLPRGRFGAGAATVVDAGADPPEDATCAAASRAAAAASSFFSAS